MSAATRALARSRGRGFPFTAPTWPTSLRREPPERRLGADYATEWARRYPVRLARAMVVDSITRPIAHLVAVPEVRGEDLMRLVEPPVIFVANHTSHVDTPLLVSLLPVRFRHRTVVAAAADHFFDRRWKAHMWAGALNAIPIERHKVNRRSADVAGALLDEGWNLVIFPEGGRSPDGWFQPFRGGAAYLAVRSGRPVVPVHLDGTWRVLPKDARRLRRGRTTVRFGLPLSPDEGEDARRFGTRIETALATMADEARTDWWTARRRAAAGTTPSPQGPDAAPWRRAWALGPDPTDADSADPGRWAVEPR
ncbi:MAG TPA: lysophospholipid acyltransferase family protein [Acidimicrobiales bacterium]|nr:lysophospholipid acyltransferase family protein [Acidimicrobiales bacterium]